MNVKPDLRLLLFLLLALVNNAGLGQVNFTDSNLPIIVINTNEQEIVDDPKIDCEMGIIWNGEGNRNYLSDPFNDYNGHIGIEIRGSTSQQYPKKSYGLETRDAQGDNLNVSLLGLPKENDWILYGAFPDKSLMRNEITYSIFSALQPWSPRFVYCELVINDEYLGVYTLIEKVKRDKDRIDIEKLDENDISGDELTGGYVIKIDKLTGSSNIPWNSAYQDSLKFLYHDPKFDELVSEQRDYIKKYVSDFEDAVYGDSFSNPETGYRAYINTQSFIDFMIMQELGRTVDGYRSSSFMYKDRDSKGGKLTCGPMWDFNLSYGNANYCNAYELEGWQYNFAEVCGGPGYPDVPDWWSRMLEDSTYSNELKCRWTELRSGLLSTDSIHNWIDSMAVYLDEAQERNFTKWPILGEFVNWNFFVGNTYEEELDYLKLWFEERSAYLDENFPGVCNDWVSSEKAVISQSSISLYPNPSKGVFYFSEPIKRGEEISVFDCTGQLIDFEINNDALDLSDHVKGIYFVRVNDQYFKVLKE